MNREKRGREMSKRYIDADKYKQDLIQVGFLPALVVRVLDKQPTADVVDVVRCKDCKHYKDEHSNCWLMRVKMMPSDYCSYGERREDQE